MNVPRQAGVFVRNQFAGLFAQAAGISEKVADRMIRRMTGFLPKWIALCEDSFLPPDLKPALIELMQARVRRLELNGNND